MFPLDSSKVDIKNMVWKRTFDVILSVIQCALKYRKKIIGKIKDIGLEGVIF